MTSFIDLATALGRSWQVQALQPRGLDGLGVPYSTVPAAARACLNALKRRHPGTPINLLGHSFGGWVALEMALQLHASGCAVNSLTIIDSKVPGGAQPREYNRAEALMEMVRLFELAAERKLNIALSDLEALELKSTTRIAA